MGNDGKAVVFSVSAPSGTFENGITAQTGTFSGSVSAGSFTTSGSFNVLGQTTFANASTTDLSISGNTYFPGGIWNSSGYVGIGTSNPLVKLQITDGDISLDTGRALYAYGIGGPGSVNSAWGTFYSTATQTRFVTSGIGTSSTTIPMMKFSKWNGTLTTHMMSIDPSNNGVAIGSYATAGTAPANGLTVSGNVGIGTITPYSRLSVWGLSTGTNRMFELTDSASTTLMTVLDNGTAYFKGNLGIGTTTPSANLAVQGNSYVSGTSFFGGAITATSTFTVSGLTTLVNASTTQLTTTGSTYLATMGGNVGIGTTSPSALLTVGNNNQFTVSSAGVISAAGGIAVGGTAQQGTGSLVMFPGLYPYSSVGGALYSGTRKIIESAGNSTAIWDYNSVTNPVISLSVQSTVEGVRLGSGTVLDWSSTLDPVATSDTGFSRLSAGKLAFGNGSSGDYSGTFIAGKLGIGTTTPYAKLTVWGSDTLASSINTEWVNSASTTLARIMNDGTFYTLGNFGIGTTSPMTTFTVAGVNATSTIEGNLNVGNGALTYTSSTGIVDIPNITVGASVFESDAGMFSWTDLPVTSASVLGQVNSYSAQIDSNPMLTVYSESLGDGTVWNTGVGIGTTTPRATFQIQSATSTAGTFPIFDISGLLGSSFMRMNANGALSIGGTTTIGTTGQMAGLQIGNGGLCVDSDGSCTASTTGRISSVSSTVGSTDLAENYSSTESLEPGEVVTIGDEGGASVKRASIGTDVVIGIISTDPGVLLGFPMDNATTTRPTLYPVALAGRVPVKVTGEAITKGDRLTLSGTTGIAKKATTQGQTIGIALEDWNGGNGKNTVLTFVNLSWQGMLENAVAGDPTALANDTAFFDQLTNAIADKLVNFKDIVVENLTAAVGMFTRVTTDTVEVKKGIEMKDQVTGEIYCVTLANGDWVKTKGVCSTTAPADTGSGGEDGTGTTPDPTATLPDPAPTPEPTDTTVIPPTPTPDPIVTPPTDTTTPAPDTTTTVTP